MVCLKTNLHKVRKLNYLHKQITQDIQIHSHVFTWAVKAINLLEIFKVPDNVGILHSRHKKCQGKKNLKRCQRNFYYCNE